MSRQARNKREKWFNKCIIIKSILCTCGAESDIIIKCGTLGPFILFDTTDSMFKSSSRALIRIGGGNVKTALLPERKVTYEKTKHRNVKKIRYAVGKVIEVIRSIKDDRNTILVDIGGIYIEGKDEQTKKARVGDFVEFTQGIHCAWEIILVD